MHSLLVVLKPPRKLVDAVNGDDNVNVCWLVLYHLTVQHDIAGVIDLMERGSYVPVAQIYLGSVASAQSYSSISSSFG